MSKRRADVANLETTLQETGIDDDDWFEKLITVDEEQVIKIVGEIINTCNIDNRSLKRARTELPSFSRAKWSDFAEKKGFPTEPSLVRLEPFVTPVYELPPSFHKAVMEDSWHTQDVYQEVVERTNEESVFKKLEPYLVPILALFQGRVIDKPDGIMPGDAYATGGGLEHEIIMIGGILFFVIEAKSANMPDNGLAQIFLELLSAAETNKSVDFEGLRIYGILTNLQQFNFYSYEPKTNTFCRDEVIFIEVLRDGFATWMTHISNKIFGLILTAFMEGLRAIIKKSKKSKKRTVSIGQGSAVLGQSPVSADINPDVQDSTDAWELALCYAEDCCRKFTEKATSIQDMENRSTEALGLLTTSIRFIPRFSAYTSKAQSSCLTPTELKDFASQTVENALQIYLS